MNPPAIPIPAIRRDLRLLVCPAPPPRGRRFAPRPRFPLTARFLGSCRFSSYNSGISYVSAEALGLHSQTALFPTAKTRIVSPSAFYVTVSYLAHTGFPCPGMVFTDTRGTPFLHSLLGSCRIHLPPHRVSPSHSGWICLYRFSWLQACLQGFKLSSVPGFTRSSVPARRC